MKTKLIILMVVALSLLNCNSMKNDSVPGEWKLNICFDNGYGGLSGFKNRVIELSGDSDRGEFTDNGFFNGSYSVTGDIIFLRSYGESGINLRGVVSDEYITGEAWTGSITRGTFEMGKMK